MKKAKRNTIAGAQVEFRRCMAKMHADILRLQQLIAAEQAKRAPDPPAPDDMQRLLALATERAEIFETLYRVEHDHRQALEFSLARWTSGKVFESFDA